MRWRTDRRGAGARHGEVDLGEIPGDVVLTRMGADCLRLRHRRHAEGEDIAQYPGVEAAVPHAATLPTDAWGIRRG